MTKRHKNVNFVNKLQKYTFKWQKDKVIKKSHKHVKNIIN